MQKRGIRLGGRALHSPLDVRKNTGEIPPNNFGDQAVGFVGQHCHSHSRFFQPGQQFLYAGIRSRLVLLVGVVVGHELLQDSRDPLRGVPVLRGKTDGQLGHAVAHIALVFLHGVGGPAMAAAHPVSRVRQVVNGIQESTIQIKNNILIHMLRPCKITRKRQFPCSQSPQWCPGGTPTAGGTPSPPSGRAWD